MTDFFNDEQIKGLFKNRGYVEADRIPVFDDQPFNQLTWEEISQELDEKLSIQDLTSITFLMITNKNVEVQFKLCKVLETTQKNEIKNNLIPPSAGTIQLHYKSSLLNNDRNFSARLIEALYHTNNFLFLQNYFNISKEDVRFKKGSSVLDPATITLYNICSESLSNTTEEITQKLGLEKLGYPKSIFLETAFLNYVFHHKITMKSFVEDLWIPESLTSYLLNHGFIPKSISGSLGYPQGEGFVLIFNNENFTRTDNESKNLDSRRGTGIDRNNLIEVFSYLGATVRFFDDMVLNDMEEVMKNVASEVNSQPYKYKWLAVCMLSHGMKNQCGKDLVYTSDCKPLDRKEIIMEFLDNRLHNLKDKPKFFFFIACRTEEKELLEEQDEMMVATIQEDGPVRPVPEVDHLVCSSTVDTYSSFRCTQHGSFYVQILCDQLMQYGHEQDLVSIMTKVNSKMAETFNTYPSMSEMSSNTLRSKFFFAVDENQKKDNANSGLCLLTHH